MQGLEAISANNGWAMALAGSCIVITGLATLSFIISQLHRLIGLFEKKVPAEKAISETVSAPAPVDASTAEYHLFTDLAVTARVCQPLTLDLGETFGLVQLYRLMDANDLPHPHITVRELRGAGYLVPTGEGTFSWENV